MIFPSVQAEATVQVDDKTRLDASKSFVSQDEAAITLVEIEPEAAAGYIDVTSGKYLDWQYDADGDKVVTVRITTDGAPISKATTITVVTLAADKLFSTDEELVSYEPDILDYTRPGRNTFKNVHRAAQERVLEYLDAKRIHNTDGSRLTKANIYDIEEVNDWSRYTVLMMIFEGLQTSVDDVYADKALKYRDLMKMSRERAIFRLDLDEDGVEDLAKDNFSYRLVRR